MIAFIIANNCSEATLTLRVRLDKAYVSGCVFAFFVMTNSRTPQRILCK